MSNKEFWKRYVLENGGARYRVDVVRISDGVRIARHFLYGWKGEIFNSYSDNFGPGYRVTVCPVKGGK